MEEDIKDYLVIYKVRHLDGDDQDMIEETKEREFHCCPSDLNKRIQDEKKEIARWLSPYNRLSVTVQQIFPL